MSSFVQPALSGLVASAEAQGLATKRAKQQQAKEKEPPLSEAEKAEIAVHLYDGALIDSLRQDLALYVGRRREDPKRYWRVLSNPTKPEEIEERDDVLNDLAWIVGRAPLFVGCMAYLGANIDTFIDAISEGFKRELVLLKLHQRGGPVFAGVAIG